MSTRNFGSGHTRRDTHDKHDAADLASREEAQRSLSDEVVGIAGVLHALEGIEFPLSKGDLLEKLRGKRVIGWRGGGLIDFDELLADSDESFGSKLGFMSFVSERLREQRESSVRGGSSVGWSGEEMSRS